jgi:hypothetical protein
MQDQSRANRLFAVALSVLAGFVDGVGFLELGGFFVSFMSGNATRLGVNASELAPGALVAIALALSFMLGVMLGTLVGESAGRTRPAWVLGLVGSLLASAAWLGHLGQSALASAMMALAMGAENATLVSKDGSLFGARSARRRRVRLEHIPLALERPGGRRRRRSPGLLGARAPQSLGCGRGCVRPRGSSQASARSGEGRIGASLAAARA